MAKIKVWGGRYGYHNRSRGIIATTSEQKVADAFNLTKNEIRTYWCGTGNALELEIANSKVGQPFVSDVDWSKNKDDYITLEEWIKRGGIR